MSPISTNILLVILGLTPSLVWLYFYSKKDCHPEPKYLLTKTTKEGTVPSLSTRALADLASAFEKAQAMTYLALNDTAQERVKRNETVDAEQSGGELHARIAAAMAEVRTSNTPRAMLLDAQLAVAQSTAAVAKKESPLDNDNH